MEVPTLPLLELFDFAPALTPAPAQPVLVHTYITRTFPPALQGITLLL